MKNPWESINVPKIFAGTLMPRRAPSLGFIFREGHIGKLPFHSRRPHANVRDKEISVKLSGIEVEPYRNGDRGGLTLKLLDKNDWEIFYALCNDLIDATEKAVDEESGPE